MEDGEVELIAAANMVFEGKHLEAVGKLTSLVDRGVSRANYVLGFVYEFGGADVPRNAEYACFYYEAAAQAGWAPGYLGLGRVFYCGKGVEPDYQKAMHYFSQLEGEANPISDYYLGYMHMYGQGTQRDLEQARRFLSRSADAGYMYAASLMAKLEWSDRAYRRSLALRLRIVGYGLSRMFRNRSIDDNWRTDAPGENLGPTGTY